MRIRIALVLSALFVLGLTAGTAEAKPTCHGKKATVVLTPSHNRYVAPHQGHGNQVVVGSSGADYIVTGKGSDVICGGGGNDRILAGRGSDRVYGGPGDDVIINIKGNDQSFGEDGNDQIVGGPSPDYIDGGTGNDQIDGGSDRDNLHGGPGDDLIMGGDGSDTISGDDGNDEIHGGSGGEDMSGGNGDDRMYGDLLDDQMDGGPGNDLLVGGHGTDRMSGGPGNDWMRGGPNGDSYSGGDGSDTISYGDVTPSQDTTTGVDANLGSGTIVTPDGTESETGVENVLGSAFDDTITGTSGPDGLDGGPGNDKLTGGGGADAMTGGPGTDTCDSGVGDHVSSCGIGGLEVPPDPRPSTAYVYLDNRGPDPGLYVLGQTGGGSDNLVVTATSAAYTVTSLAGTAISKLPVNVNTCTLLSPSGASCAPPSAGPLGFVTAWGDQGNDRLDLSGSFPDTTTTLLDGGPGSDVLDGSPGDDIIFSGQSGNDVLNGGDGSDALLGLGTGGDQLNGGPGNDQLVTDDVCQGHDYSGGPGFDIAGFARYRYASARNGVTATLGGTAFDPNRRGCDPSHLAGDLEILEGSDGPDVLTGTNGKDPLILGRGGDDVINGLGGADTVDGGAGNDTLLGGGGFDTLESKDGTRDRSVNCGPGGGQAYRDNSDPVSGCRKLKGSQRKRQGR